MDPNQFWHVPLPGPWKQPQKTCLVVPQPGGVILEIKKIKLSPYGPGLLRHCLRHLFQLLLSNFLKTSQKRYSNSNSSFFGGEVGNRTPFQWAERSKLGHRVSGNFFGGGEGIWALLNGPSGMRPVNSWPVNGFSGPRSGPTLLEQFIYVSSCMHYRSTTC